MSSNSSRHAPNGRRSATAALAVSWAVLVGGCAGAPAPDRLPDVAPHVGAVGERIYVGRVFPLHGTGGAAPTYVYERRVDGDGDQLVSTHVTRDGAGVVQLAESAHHAADYSLRDYELHRNQLGQRGTVHVSGRAVTFRRLDGDQVRERRESSDTPVVVGPTLVGYVVRHLPELERGARLPVRLALLDRMETFGFELSAERSAADETRIVMRPSSFFVGLAVAPVTFTFDGARKLRRLEGPVPTKLRRDGHLHDFDARVEYDFVASAYR